MKGNWALLILGALLLVQLSYLAPTQTQSKDMDKSIKIFYEEESEEELLIKNLTERRRIHNFRRDHVIELVNLTIQEAKNFLKGIVQELKTRQSQYPLLSAHITKLTKFIDDMNKMGENPSKEQYQDLFKNFDEYMEIFKAYETSSIDKPSDEVNMIEKLLDGTDWNHLMLGFSFGFIGLAMNLTKEVKVYIDSLTDQQKVQERELIEWFNKQNFVFDDKSGY